MIFTYILLAISTSIDSLGIGLTYGIREITISTNAKVILFIMSISIATIAILIGNALVNFLPLGLTNFIGSSILFVMAAIILFQVLKKEKKEDRKKVYKLFIKFLGVTIQIIKDPVKSDIDKSNKIDSKEAIYLGLALSLDCFSIGIGAGILSTFSFLFPILVAIFQISFLSIGKLAGSNLNNKFNVSNKIWNILSATLLLIIGIMRLV